MFKQYQRDDGDHLCGHYSWIMVSASPSNTLFLRRCAMPSAYFNGSWPRALLIVASGPTCVPNNAAVAPPFSPFGFDRE